MPSKMPNALYVCRRSYKCYVRSGHAWEGYPKQFRDLCHHGPAQECMDAGRCLAVRYVLGKGGA